MIEFRDGVAFPGGYGYSADGTLRSRAAPHGGFAWGGQGAYDALSEAVLAYAADVVLLSAGLERRDGAAWGGGAGAPPIWVSAGAVAGPPPRRTLLLLQGSGRVRAGVWGCALCINAEQGLHKGTMLGYIERAHAAGYRVVVANPNAAQDAAQHTVDVWERQCIAGEGGTAAAAGSVDVVAHSNGGRCFLGLLLHLAAHGGSINRLGKVACTDSYHRAAQVRALGALGAEGEAALQLLRGVRNYVPSDAPFGAVVQSWVSLKREMTAASMAPMHCISCTCDDHASTNYAAMDAIFAWFMATE